MLDKNLSEHLLPSLYHWLDSLDKYLIFEDRHSRLIVQPIFPEGKEQYQFLVRSKTLPVIPFGKSEEREITSPLFEGEEGETFEGNMFTEWLSVIFENMDFIPKKIILGEREDNVHPEF